MSLLATLRAETADSHIGLEKSLDVFAQVRTKADYRALVGNFFTLYEPLESQLAAAADWAARGWNFSARLKTPLLREDLQALGETAAEIEKKLRWPGRLSVGVGEAIGVLYVLEGSTLGGQMISKQFKEKLGITSENGGKFFHGYGESTGRQWRAFGQWAETQSLVENGALQSRAVASARGTFNIFAQWLTT